MHENNLMQSRFSFGVQQAQRHLSELKGRILGKKMHSVAAIASSSPKRLNDAQKD
jgi:hypothetical protein